MVVWLLKDGADYMAVNRGRVAAERVTCFGDVYACQVSDYPDEAMARSDAEAVNREQRTSWVPVAIDFSDAREEDFQERFQD